MTRMTVNQAELRRSMLATVTSLALVLILSLWANPASAQEDVVLGWQGRALPLITTINSSQIYWLPEVTLAPAGEPGRYHAVATWEEYDASAHPQAIWASVWGLFCNRFGSPSTDMCWTPPARVSSGSPRDTPWLPLEPSHRTAVDPSGNAVVIWGQLDGLWSSRFVPNASSTDSWAIAGSWDPPCSSALRGG